MNYRHMTTSELQQEVARLSDLVPRVRVRLNAAQQLLAQLTDPEERTACEDAIADAEEGIEVLQAELRAAQAEAARRARAERQRVVAARVAAMINERGGDEQGGITLPRA